MMITDWYGVSYLNQMSLQSRLETGVVTAGSDDAVRFIMNIMAVDRRSSRYN